MLPLNTALTYLIVDGDTEYKSVQHTNNLDIIPLIIV